MTREESFIRSKPDAFKIDMYVPEHYVPLISHQFRWSPNHSTINTTLYIRYRIACTITISKAMINNGA